MLGSSILGVTFLGGNPGGRRRTAPNIQITVIELPKTEVVV